MVSRDPRSQIRERMKTYYIELRFSLKFMITSLSLNVLGYFGLSYTVIPFELDPSICLDRFVGHSNFNELLLVIFLLLFTLFNVFIRMIFGPLLFLSLVYVVVGGTSF